MRFEWFDGRSVNEAEALAVVGAALDEGKVVLMPTDTVPGLVACALRADGVERIAQLKGRSVLQPPPVLVASLEEALTWCHPRRHEVLVKLATLWPGPLSVVVEAPRLARTVNPGGVTVALRVPDLAWLRELAQHRPLAASSANPHGQPTAPTPRAALAALASRVDVGELGLAGVLDAVGGEATAPSTIVEVVDERPRVVREGALGLEVLARCLGADLDTLRRPAGA